MKTRISVLFLLGIFCAAHAFSQKNEGKPNFSGTWEYEKSEDSTGRLLFDKSSENIKIFHQVVIEQKEPEIKIVEKIRYEFVNLKTKKSVVAQDESALTYFTDERGEINTVNQKNVNSVTKWKGSVLSINFYDAKKNVVGTVEWKISKESDRLISIKKEKNPKNVAPLILLVNVSLNNKTTFTRKQ